MGKIIVDQILGEGGGVHVWPLSKFATDNLGSAPSRFLSLSELSLNCNLNGYPMYTNIFSYPFDM